MAPASRIIRRCLYFNSPYKIIFFLIYLPIVAAQDAGPRAMIVPTLTGRALGKGWWGGSLICCRLISPPLGFKDCGYCLFHPTTFRLHGSEQRSYRIFGSERWACGPFGFSLYFCSSFFFNPQFGAFLTPAPTAAVSFYFRP